MASLASGLLNQARPRVVWRADGANDGLLLDDYAALDMPLMCRGRGRGRERLAGTILQRKFGSTR